MAIRKKKIEGLEEVLEKMRAVSRQWTGRANESGQAHDRFSVTCIDFMIQLQEGWISTEKELLEVEKAILESSEKLTIRKNQSSKSHRKTGKKKQ